MGKFIALFSVARRAGTDDILPAILTTSALRQNVIKSELASGEFIVAVLAGEVVSPKNIVTTKAHKLTTFMA
jgi:hypothetical protein